MLNGITSGDWLNTDLFGNDLYTKSVIASTAWFIWKARCNGIFRIEPLNCFTTYKLALGHIRKYSITSSVHIGKILIQNNFSSSDSPFIFIAATWNLATSIVGIAFFNVDSSSAFLRACCYSVFAESDDDVEAKAMIITLKILLDWRLLTKHIFSNDAALVKAVK